MQIKTIVFGYYILYDRVYVIENISSELNVEFAFSLPPRYRWPIDAMSTSPRRTWSQSGDILHLPGMMAPNQLHLCLSTSLGT